jgi:hypothetical protein
MAQPFGDSNIGDYYSRPSPARPAATPSSTPMGDMGYQTPTKVGTNWGTPSSGSSGGGVPGGGFYGRPSENGPTLSPNLLGRYAPTERFNYFEVLGNNTSTEAGWVSIVCERPTLLVPTEQLFGSVYYAPHSIPSTFGSGSALLNAERAEGPGVVYLWAPGTWWIKYNATTASNLRAKFRQMSAEDPAIVAAAMSMPGAQKVSTSEVNTGAASTQTQLLAANPARRAVMIQLKSAPGANVLYIALNGTASSTVNSMVLSAQWQTVTFSDEAMNTGIVQCVTAGANYLVQVTEYE